MDLERRLHEAILDSSSIRAEMNELQSQKIDRENELNVELAKMKEQSETRLENLNREIDVLKESFQKERETYKISVAEKDAKCKRIQSELLTNTSVLESTVESLKTENMDITARFLSKSESLQQIISVSHEEQEKLKQVVQNMKIEEEKLRLILEDSIISKTAGDFEFLSQINQKNNVISNLEQQIQEFQIQLQENSDINTKTSVQLRELEEEQVDLVNRKEEYKTMCGDLSQELEKLDAEKTSIEEMLDILQKEFAMFKEISIKSEESWEVKYQEAKMLYENLAKENESKTLLLSSSISFSNDLKNELNTNSQELQTKTADMRMLENELKIFSEEQVVHKNLLNIKETEIELLKEELSKKDMFIQELNEKVDGLNKCIADETGNVSTFKENVAQEQNKLQTALAHQNQNCLLLEHKIKETEKKLIDRELQMAQEASKNILLESENSLKIQGLIDEIDTLEEINKEEVKVLTSKLCVCVNKYTLYVNNIYVMF